MLWLTKSCYSHQTQLVLRKCASSWTSPRTLEKAQANTEHRCPDNYLHTMRDHITPIIKQLHWLPIKRRIEFKILLHVFRCINGTAPLYLADMLKRQCSTGRTRSPQQHLLAVSRTKLVSFGDRSFNVVGPRLWNALPIAIKRIETVPLFVKALKTHIFKEELC